MADWKPITTAPKDGSEILIAYKAKSLMMPAVYYIAAWDENAEKYRDQCDGSVFQTYPDYWLEIPEPPND